MTTVAPTGFDNVVAASQKKLDIEAHVYTHFQFIAYEVPTNEALNAGNVYKSDLLDLLKLDDLENEHLGEKLSDDARARLARMVSVVQKAYESASVDRADTTLKVFMAPEFYFRPEEKGDTSRSYPEDYKDIIVQALANITKIEAFAHWMFVFGTIAWAQSGKEALKGAKISKGVDLSSIATSDKKFFINTALVVSSTFDTQAVPGIATFDKKSYSDADEVDPAHQLAIGTFASPSSRNVTKSLRNVLQGASSTNVSSLLNQNARQGTIDALVVINGNMGIGLEVCNDHANGRLGECIRSRKQQGLRTLIGLQLITACGMEVQPRQVVVDKDRFVLRVDGQARVPSNDWKPPYVYSEIQRRTGTDTKNDATMTVASSAKNDDWKAINRIKQQIMLAGDLKLDVSGCDPVTRYKWAYSEQEKALVRTDATASIAFDEAYPQRVVIYELLPFQYASPQSLNNNI